jgi:L-asparagine transporter-like permease
MNVKEEQKGALGQPLRRRHVEMIAIGGIIGAGLFVGSSVAIATIGPAALVSYALAGLLVLLVMRMLGEIAANHPGGGSFVDYIRLGLGQPAGFVSAWLYWYVFVIVIAIEAIIGAQIMSAWIPAPAWVIGCALLAILTAVNVVSTRSFGEVEFLLSSLKVGAILVFIVIVASYVFGFSGGRAIGLENLTSHEGFAPRGGVAILAGITTVIFSMIGAEVVTVAATESTDPARVVGSMTSRLVVRVLLFYVTSIGLILCVVPWSEVTPGVSPFATALDRLGIPAGATIMNAVTLIAVLSALNTGIYVTSRILFKLSTHGEAPAALVKTGRRRVPVGAVLVSTAFAYGALIVSVATPSAVFSFLVNASGALSLVLYALIGFSQIKLRRRQEARGERPTLPMWIFPGLSYLVIAAIAAVLISMAFSPDFSSQFYTSLFSIVVAIVAWALHRWSTRRRHPSRDVSTNLP